MRLIRFALCVGAILSLSLVLAVEPAAARRTVVDSSITWDLTGYCSPNSAATSACTPYNLTFPIQYGGTAYSSFYVNSNGTVSFGSIESFLAPQNSATPPTPQTSLADYGAVPVFSPNFADGQGFLPINPSQGYDGNFVAVTTLSPNGFTVIWYSCINPLACGQATIDLVDNATFDANQVGQFGLVDNIIQASGLANPNATPEENFANGRLNLLALDSSTFPMYTMTLLELQNGFQVDYSYSLGALGDTGTHGYSLPGAFFETTGPLQNQTFVFRDDVQTPSVPEPTTWATMLLGFSLLGSLLRRDRRRLQLKSS